MAGSGAAHLRSGDADVVLRVEDLVVEFRVPGGTVHAVSGLSFDIERGETLGLVGESGCGKSTTGRAVMSLTPMTSGSVRFKDQELSALSGKQARRASQGMQMVFQDPISSLNPRRRIVDTVSDGLAVNTDLSRAEIRAKVDSVLEAVGLDPVAVAKRRPRQFSGGQCQRIGIARALSMEPTLIICDEPVSALDVSVQAQILNLLEDMKSRFSLTMLFIAHDLAVVKAISDRVLVLYMGKFCELASAADLYARPAHPYTRILLDSVPRSTPERVVPIVAPPGDTPSALDPPSGCRFRTRCPKAQDRCVSEEPMVREWVPGQFVACHFPGEEAAG
jgi:peptide/nickel transport system ATP-binding protein